MRENLSAFVIGSGYWEGLCETVPLSVFVKWSGEEEWIVRWQFHPKAVEGFCDTKDVCNKMVKQIHCQ